MPKDQRVHVAALRAGLRRAEGREAPPLEARPYARWLLDLRRHFGAEQVALFRRCPTGWSFEEWQRRRSLDPTGT